jgi:hypothetical protein
MADLEDAALIRFPVSHALASGRPAASPGHGQILSSLEPSFRAQEAGAAVAGIAASVQLTLAARNRSWLGHLLAAIPSAPGPR